VNVNAPKTGIARQIALGTYDNFNLVLAGVKGTLAAGIDLIYDTLLVPALDEVSGYYGLLAEAVSYPDDFSLVRYRLRAGAKWHDGSPITPDDVIFSFETFKKYSPQAAANYRHVIKVEQTAERELTFRFDEPDNRTLPQIVGQLTILPKAWWESTDADGHQRQIEATTLTPPLGSGPYRIKEFSPGRSIVYERVAHYWGGNLNVNVGRDNFDELSFEYFRDPTAAIESFKVDRADWRIENSAKNWNSAYDFAAVSDKRVILEEFPVRNISLMQGFAFNARRQKFSSTLVRLAFNYAFDFDEINKQLFFGQYQRIASYFEGTELAAAGLPSGRELELLESVRQHIPPSVFTTPYSNPVSGTAAAARNNLRESVRLLKQAGYEVRDRQLVDTKTGEPYTVEFLGNSAAFERVFLFYKPALERIGMSVTVRTVDEPQYENRLRNWDFDVITYAWPETLLPGNELRGYWGSQTADQGGSDNVIGIKNPAVDAMIDHVLVAKSHDDLVSACKALDRVLLWNHYVVPQWTYNKLRVARWDRFGHPDPLPEYGVTAFPTIWWLDAKKAARLGGA
jgi:microcin C transport system substrate-binding protein